MEVFDSVRQSENTRLDVGTLKASLSGICLEFWEKCYEKINLRRKRLNVRDGREF